MAEEHGAQQACSKTGPAGGGVSDGCFIFFDAASFREAMAKVVSHCIGNKKISYIWIIMKTESIDPKRWTILRSDYVLREPWLTVRRDHVRQPNGVEIPDYWVLEYPEWVNVIAITTDGKFVMERQYRHAMGFTAYEICAGTAERGEAPLEAARRELSEETGYEGGEWEKFVTTSPNGTSMTNMTHTYIARNVARTRDAHQEPTEDIDVVLMDEEEVLHLLATQQIVQATMVAPLWKFFYERKRGK